MQTNRFIGSRARIFLFSLTASLFVLAVSLLIQWLVYDDLLHQTGPLRIIGTSIAAVVTFCFVLRWQRIAHERQHEMTRRFEMISVMNDRIRNSLQTIECLSFLHQPDATHSVREAADAIDEVLREVVSELGHKKRGLQARQMGDSSVEM